MRRTTGFYEFTGCDYTSSAKERSGHLPSWKRTKKPRKQSRAKLQTTIYGAKDNTKLTLNEHRYKIFENGYGTNSSSKNPLAKLKEINSSSIPACEAELNMHIKRAAFVAQMWANADSTEIQQHPDETNGWDLESGCYTLL